MRFQSCLATLLVGTALCAGPATAGVKVTFANPASYADLDRRAGDVKRELRLYLQRLGAQLGPGLDLSVTVLDINLAGIEHPVRGPSFPRIMTGATPPSLRLRYVLTRNGRTIASGEDSVSDHFYLSRPGARSGDALTYEKTLLNDWFDRRFADHLKRR